MTGPDLLALLAEQGLSTRELARWLDVSPMWVSRRTTGQVPITDDEAARIRGTLAQIADAWTAERAAAEIRRNTP